MGKHQWLANGAMLILLAMNGRIFKITPDMQVVWGVIILLFKRA